MNFWNAVLDAINPFQPYYAVGGLLNEATGGTTTTYSFSDALMGGSSGTVFSNAIMAASAYDPGSNIADGKLGGLQLPIFNVHTPAAVRDAVDILPPWLKWAAVAVGAVVVLK